MSKDTTFRLRRKQDGFITEPVTQKQAEGLAGYPGDFEKVAEVKKLVVKDDADDAPKTATTRTAARKRTTSKRAPATKAAASTATATPAPSTTSTATPATGAASSEG